ncbi:MAG: hypothetical protein KJZ87_05040 [Thermoguttaceae bacterium]|nr:hypothetical protein [Thermoguttaceae bacterium]
MLDYQNIVDTCRALTVPGAEAPAEFVAAAAADYSLACQKVNARLSRCGELLRRGLRSEALQQADIDPNLVDLTGLLDFPEREAFLRLCVAHRIAVPTSIDLDIAAELNQAYAAEQPIESLLRVHRRYAMARAPIAERLVILRRLAELDPQSPIWREDVLLFEKERARELRTELLAADRAGDLNRIVVLDREVHSDSWLEIPFESLLNLATTLRDKHTVRRAREELEEIARGLNAAFSSFDLVNARRLRDEWTKKLPAGRINSDHPIFERAGPALDWIAAQDEAEVRLNEHRRAVAELEEAIELREPLEELERLYHLATEHGHAVPEVLTTRFRNRVALLQAAAVRRTRILTTSIVCFSLLAAAAVGTIVWFQVQRSRMTAHCTALQQLIDANKLPEALRYVERLETDAPGLTRTAALAELIVTVHALDAETQERKVDFQAAIRAADIGEAAVDENELRRAAELANSTEEKAQVASLQQKAQRLHAAEQQRQDKAYLDELQRLAARLDAMDEEPLRDPDSRWAELREIKTELAAAGRSYPQITPVAAAQKKTIEARLSALEAGVDRLRRDRAHEKELAARINQQEAFLAELTKYTELPDANPARKADYQQVLSETPLMETVASWNRLAEKWNSEDRSDWGPQEASRATAEIQEVLQKAGAAPAAGTLETIQTYLAKIKARQPVEGKKPLVAMLGDKLITDTWMIRTKDGKRYYFEHDPDIRAGSYKGLDYYTDFNYNVKRESFGLDSITYQGRAPQVVLAQEVGEYLKSPKNRDWERAFCNAITALRRPTPADGLPEVDPILLLRLLNQTLKVACASSEAMTVGFSSWQQSLERSQVSPYANWLDPDDPKGTDQRNLATLEMSSLPDLQASIMAVAERRRQFLTERLAIYEWIGSLRRSGTANWICSMGTDVKSRSDGDLYVLVRDAGSGKANWITVGKLVAGTAQISIGAVSLVEGRPVYLEVR